ncbi:hypothetical protein DXG01_016530, partial [Tephrocybe rancida]
MRSGFRSTENVINRLVVFSINVGLVTSAITIGIVIIYKVTANLLLAASGFLAIGK